MVQHYNPATGPRPLVSSAIWHDIGPVVVKGVEPLLDLPGQQVRPYLNAMTRLVSWSHSHGYALSARTVLATRMVRAYVSTLKPGDADDEPFLWRLSKAWNLTPEGAKVRDSVARRDYQAPYAASEVDALLFAAQCQNSQHRRATLLAIVALGAGCGVTRESARDARGSQLHQHDDDWFFATPTHCAKVRPELLGVLNEVIALRPVGRLRGDAEEKFITSMAAKWVKDRRGVPALSIDRLRSTYVCDLLAHGASLIDVLDWTGLNGAESLNGYLKYVERPSHRCATMSRGAK